MAEVLDQLETLAKERADALERTSKSLAGETEGFLFIANDSCNFVRFLSLLWELVQARLRKGGVPAKFLLHECDLLLGLLAHVGQHVALIDKVWKERSLPDEISQPIYQDVQDTRRRLEALLHQIRAVRERASTPPRVAVEPAQLSSRIRQADEAGDWRKLTDVVSRMQRPSSSSQE